MNIFLLLAGDYIAPAVVPKAGDALIAVDGGMRHAACLGMTADVWLGDFDSADNILIKQYPHVPRLPFAADKTQTDFELALAHANRHYRQGTLHILGSGGDEADHAFANLWVLPQSTLPCVLWQENAVIVAAHGAFALRFAAPQGSKVSLFSATPLCGVHACGLRWTLADAELSPFQAFAARNEMAADEAQIRWQSGFGMVFLPRPVSELQIAREKRPG